MRKLENEEMRKLENQRISKWGASYKLAPEEINFAKVSVAKVMCWGLLGGFGRKRKRAEERREGF